MTQPIRHAFTRVWGAFISVWDSRWVGLRVVRGVLSLLVPFLFLGIIALFLEVLSNRYNLNRDSFWGWQIEWLLEVVPLLFVTIFMAGFIVYFLRFLHWLRTYGRSYWNEETAPHHQGRRSNSNGPRVNRPLSKSKFKFLEWSVLSLLIWLTFATLVFVLFAVQSTVGWAVPEFGATLRSAFIRFAEQVPIIGQLIVFEYYPGDGPLGTVSYLVGAIPAAIAIRNLVFIFEHIDEYKSTEDETLFRTIALSCGVVIGIVLVFDLLGVILWAVDTTFGI